MSHSISPECHYANTLPTSSETVTFGAVAQSYELVSMDSCWAGKAAVHWARSSSHVLPDSTGPAQCQRLEHAFQ